ncbi:uncharacterized protein B0I36DRAFT_353587 [Microdochium trichocladiopsis]|uniref:Uncharacterized protein n=1 Tax=Microdochium trichocladiopsis TaxID=1682393 RepID=A0A9P9BK59_9PEZI|nr:uncharacterized protein B0I36DRAFT_353587 [Microdochium trichocladiopsis]KAH7020846.1 hypothetical protein B0I36DRAFT_353587 [Microdochium trichocladiopsis]
MHFTYILLGLTASASALHLQMHIPSGCGGDYAICRNLPSNTCCRGSSGNIFRSLAFVDINRYGTELRGYEGGFCTTRVQTERSNGRTRVCLQAGSFSGGGFGWLSRKRSDGGADEQGASQEDCQVPDAFVLEDGTEFDLTGLDVATYDEL